MTVNDDFITEYGIDNFFLVFQEIMDSNTEGRVEITRRTDEGLNQRGSGILHLPNGDVHFMFVNGDGSGSQIIDFRLEENDEKV